MTELSAEHLRRAYVEIAKLPLDMSDEVAASWREQKIGLQAEAITELLRRVPTFTDDYPPDVAFVIGIAVGSMAAKIRDEDATDAYDKATIRNDRTAEDSASAPDEQASEQPSDKAVHRG